MAIKASTDNVKYSELFQMKEVDFINWVKGNPEYKAWAKEALTRTEIRKTYPRKKVYDDNGNVVKEVSKKTGKEYVKYEADYSKKPKITEVPISFVSLKKAFAFECLGVEPVAKVEKDTFRNRILDALND